MKILKRIMIIAAVLVIASIHSKSIYAAQEQLPSATGFDVFTNSDGNVCLITNDKKRTSSIYYKTIGFTISRGQFNPSAKKLANGAATEHFTVWLDEMTVDKYEKNGREINCFMMPYEDLKARIAACSGDWLQDLTDAEMYGSTAYVRFDSIMLVYHGTRTDSYEYRNSPLEGPFDDEARDLNPREIQSAEPWSAGANTGLRTHFHRWLPIMSAKPMIQNPVFLDHHVTNQNEGGISGPGAKNGSTLKNYGDYSGDPAFAGANTNTEGYNAAEGVPSTKTITGHAEASPWYGGIDVWARMAAKEIETFYRYKWVVQEKETLTGKDSLDKAITKLTEKEEEDRKNDTENLVKNKKDSHQKDGHDTGENDVNLVYHHYIKVTWTDYGESEEFGTTETGKEDPKAPEDDSTHDPKKPSPLKWQNGWKWTEKVTIHHEFGPDEEKTEEKSVSYDTEKEAKANKPSGSDIVSGPEATYADCIPKRTEFKCTAINDRVFFDDEYSNLDKKMIIYAAFEYIDPWKTIFYDLDYVTLFNECYDAKSLGFGQTVPTKSDAMKSKGAGETLTQQTFTDWFKEMEGKSALDPSLIKTTDYLVWPKIEKQYDKGKIDKTYKEDIIELQRDLIYKKTLTQNDYVMVKNPIDLFNVDGDTDGIYLGNEGEKGLIKGCDFRDAYWALAGGFTKPETVSLGTEAALRSVEMLNTGDIGKSVDASKYWYLCKNSSAQDHPGAGGEKDANAYFKDGQAKAAGANQIWEKLGSNTTPIDRTIQNGSFGTDIATSYSPMIVGPSTTTEQYARVLDGHLYAKTEIGSSGTKFKFSYWAGAHGSEEGPMDAEGNQLPGPEYVDSVNR